MGHQEDVLAVLRSMDATLKTLLALSQQRVTAARATQPKAIANDRDLDGQYGNPVLKFTPRGWTGANFKNARFSQCPAPLLDLVAESCEWSATQAEKKNELTDKGKPVADYRRADAARARGWAKRIREGTVAGPAARGNGQPADEWSADTDDGF